MYAASIQKFSQKGKRKIRYDPEFDFPGGKKMESVPDAVLEVILKHAVTKMSDLETFSLVCRRWRQAVEANKGVLLFIGMPEAYDEFEAMLDVEDVHQQQKGFCVDNATRAVAPAYFSWQKHFQSGMRQELALWMAAVCDETKQPPEVYFCALSLVDSFFGMERSGDVLRREIQQVGAAAIFMASKFCVKEMKYLEPVDVCSAAVSPKQLLKVEMRILETVNYDMYHLTAASTVTFLREAVENNRIDFRGPITIHPFTEDWVRAMMLAWEMLYICAINERLVNIRPSLIGSAIFSAALNVRYPGASMPTLSLGYDAATIARAASVVIAAVAESYKIVPNRQDDKVDVALVNEDLGMLIGAHVC